MPLGKYYCDYCEKQFQDTPAARKRHLDGAQHHRARALWYDAVRRQELHGGGGGAPPLLHQPGAAAIGVCQHFVRTGTCKFGDSCRYFHPKPPPANPGPAPSGNILGGHTSWGNLPPSLRPPPEGGYPPFPFIVCIQAAWRSTPGHRRHETSHRSSSTSLSEKKPHRRGIAGCFEQDLSASSAASLAPLTSCLSSTSTPSSKQQREESHWLLLARQLPMAVWNDAQGGATYSELLSCLFRGFR
uniref:C3H1-type domain-containing protein n=1 Tax=Oryza rufipogon TaxID=4529 RepID=A0A0E0MU08_ORYRU